MTTSVSVTEDGRITTAVPAQPARLYYGWVMLPIAMAGLIATSPGQTFGISIFNEPMRRALGLSHGKLALAYMLGTLLAALPIAWIGGLMDRYGLRRTMTGAVVLFGGACLITSQAAGWWSLFLAFFLLRLLGPGTLSFLSSNALSFWFHRRLGMVEGIRHVGMAIAMALIPALNLALLGWFGWRGAYAAFGVLVWAVMLPLMIIFFRNRPEDVGQTLDGLPPAANRPRNAPPETRGPSLLTTSFTLDEALRTRSFRIVAGGTALFGLVHTGVFFSIIPIVLDRGLTELDAAHMLTVFAVSLAAMQLIGGALADRFPAHLLLPMALAWLAAATALLNHASAAWMLHVSAAGLGISQGLYFGASNPLWARYFGRLHLGKIRGTLMTVNVAASSLGPLLLGAARDAFGNYDLILNGFAVLPLPILALSFLATPPRHVEGEEEQAASSDEHCVVVLPCTE